jgi:hypothetical protein
MLRGSALVFHNIDNMMMTVTLVRRLRDVGTMPSADRGAGRDDRDSASGHVDRTDEKVYGVRADGEFLLQEGERIDGVWQTVSTQLDGWCIGILNCNYRYLFLNINSSARNRVPFCTT